MENQQPAADEPALLCCFRIRAPRNQHSASEYWTSTIDSSTRRSEVEKLRVFSRKDITKFESEQIELLELIGEGGQAKVKKALVCRRKLNSNCLHFCWRSSEYEPTDWIVAAKLFKGNEHCAWPEEVFGRDVFCNYVCQYHGYFFHEGSFGLIMAKYDGSLRDVIDNKEMSGKKKRKNYRGRPFTDHIALGIIIQIALGMAYLHENSIQHRDLKADNIFVNVNPDTGIPWCAFIGDFDVAPTVVGTLFWRAPEILQALKESKQPVFTPKADVYSFAMTCYEILTGGIPLQTETLGASDYDAVVVSGTRPELPSSLIPKMKDLITRCWHHDPDARPTFEEIVVELKEVVAIFGEDIVSVFTGRFSMAEVVPLDPERSLLELKDLFQLLIVKYNRADFLLIGSELVAAMEQFQSEFGLRSFMEQRALPFSPWWTRRTLLDTIFWKMCQFQKARAFIDEFSEINTKLGIVLDTITEGVKGNNYVDAETPSDEEMAARLSLQQALVAEQRSRPKLIEPHAKCIQQLNHGNRADPKFQACELCKGENLLKAQASASAGVKPDVGKVRLYLEDDDPVTSVEAKSVSSSL